MSTTPPIAEATRDLGVGTGAQQHELRILGECVEDRVMDQLRALLMIEPPDVSDNRLVLVAQHEAFAQHPRVDVLLVDRRRRIPLRDPPVDLRVPRVVVDAVEDPAELAGVYVQCGSKTGALIGVLRLPGVLGRDGRDEIRIHDPALEQIERPRIELMPQRVRSKKRAGSLSPTADSTHSEVTP